MLVKLDISAVKRTKWHEYVMRLVAGGLITAMVGLIGHKFGPVTAGLFLAFPAIFPASATLVEKRDGLEAAADDALGAAIGSIALFAFALVAFVFLARYSSALVLAEATLAWFLFAGAVWLLREAGSRKPHRLSKTR